MNMSYWDKLSFILVHGTLVGAAPELEASTEPGVADSSLLLANELTSWLDSWLDDGRVVNTPSIDANSLSDMLKTLKNGSLEYLDKKHEYSR